MNERKKEINPKMSVIVPAHGRVKLFEETMESLYGQTTREFEVVVTDDSSLEFERDEIKQIVDNYTQKGLNIKYKFTKPNLLQAPNTNQGIKNASCNYLRILHSDDLLAPNCIEKEINFLDNTPKVDFLYHEHIPFRDTDEIIFWGKKKLRFIDPKRNWLKSYIFTGTVLPSCLCFRKEVIDRVGGLNEDYKFLCDWDFFFRLLLDAHTNKKNVGKLNAGLVAWRMHDDSVTGTMQLTHFHEHEQFINDIVKIYEQEKLLPKKQIKQNYKKAEAYRYHRIIQEYRKYKNFECPLIPLKYRWQTRVKLTDILKRIFKYAKLKVKH